MAVMAQDTNERQSEGISGLDVEAHTPALDVPPKVNLGRIAVTATDSEGSSVPEELTSA